MFAVGALVAGAAIPASAKQPADQASRHVTVMTQNLYFGADLTPAIEALATGDPLLILQALTEAYSSAFGTDFPGRMAAVADAIAEQDPHFVGLQEAAVWKSGPPFDPEPAASVDADFVAMLLAALEARGLDYDVAVSASGFQFEAPVLGPAGLFDARLEISDVILVRADLERSKLEITGTGSGSYSTFLGPPSIPLPFPRQWVSVDFELKGESGRFVSTHLEAFSPLIRQAQALELLAGPLATNASVILVGDFNDQPGDGEAADLLLGLGGFTDAWAAKGTGDGFTCCQAADLTNEVSELDVRIDLALVRGAAKVKRVEVIGDEAADKTPSGLWPSDHAGVAARIQITKAK